MQQLSTPTGQKKSVVLGKTRRELLHLFFYILFKVWTVYFFVLNPHECVQVGLSVYVCMMSVCVYTCFCIHALVYAQFLLVLQTTKFSSIGLHNCGRRKIPLPRKNTTK